MKKYYFQDGEGKPNRPFPTLFHSCILIGAHFVRTQSWNREFLDVSPFIKRGTGGMWDEIPVFNFNKYIYQIMNLKQAP